MHNNSSAIILDAVKKLASSSIIYFLDWRKSLRGINIGNFQLGLIDTVCQMSRAPIGPDRMDDGRGREGEARRAQNRGSKLSNFLYTLVVLLLISRPHIAFHYLSNTFN